jgi:quercetin dioxygenase-like cupin family protein
LRDVFHQIIHFDAGSRSKFHKHSCDQILAIVEGTVKIASDTEVLTVTEGDVGLIPAGENHWHGAPDDTSMAHIYILAADDKPEQTEP